METTSRNPFNHDYFIGYINQVLPQYVKVHFPSSVLLKTFMFKGERLNGGLVGNFVVIEGEKFGFLGKILELSLPEKERLELSEKSFQNKEFLIGEKSNFEVVAQIFVKQLFQRIGLKSRCYIKIAIIKVVGF